MTSNTLPRLQTTDIDKLTIPCPDMEIQEKIVSMVSKTKTIAKQLQKEGNVLLEEAKQKVESLILGSYAKIGRYYI